jgi:hypothetical protein
VNKYLYIANKCNRKYNPRKKGGFFPMVCQLEFFTEQKSEVEYLRENVKDYKESNDKVRKSMFASYGELKKKYIELHERMQIIERNICLGKANM